MYQISLVRASHRYREVTGSNHVEVLNFSGFHIRNFINCVHNCEDHSLLESSPNWESNLRQFLTSLAVFIRCLLGEKPECWVEPSNLDCLARNDLKGEQQISACGLPFPVNERRLNKTLFSTFTSLAFKIQRGKLGKEEGWGWGGWGGDEI